MSQAFPLLKPSGRRLRLGVYPTKTYRSMAGTTVKRSFGNKQYGYQLSLTFQNRRSADVLSVIKHHEETEAGFIRFRLSNSLLVGTSDSLRTEITSLSNIRWEYAEPPEIDWSSRARDVATITVSLVGELDV